MGDPGSDPLFFFGGEKKRWNIYGQGGNRTPDAQIFSLPLYRLSYPPGNTHESRVAVVVHGMRRVNPTERGLW